MVRSLLPKVLLVAGIVTLAAAFALGQLRVTFFLIFPVLLGDGVLPFVGMLLLLAAAVAWGVGGFQGLVAQHGEPWPRDDRLELERERAVPGEVLRGPPGFDPRERGGEGAGAGGYGPPRGVVRGGGIVMLGPIPIVFGSDRGVARRLMVLGLLLTLGLLLLVLLAR